MNDMAWIKSYPEGVRWDVEIVPGAVQSITPPSPLGRIALPSTLWAGGSATANSGA
jgi:hypothetical protein